MASVTVNALLPDPRRFAPLKPGAIPEANTYNVPPLKGVVFDVDGTLW
jgi:hypothetical protein